MDQVKRLKVSEVTALEPLGKMYELVQGKRYIVTIDTNISFDQCQKMKAYMESCGITDVAIIPNTGVRLFETEKTPDALERLSIWNGWMLSRRARNRLVENGIETIDQLCQFTERDLMGMKNFGVTTLSEINLSLRAEGKSLKARP